MLKEPQRIWSKAGSSVKSLLAAALLAGTMGSAIETFSISRAAAASSTSPQITSVTPTQGQIYATGPSPGFENWVKIEGEHLTKVTKILLGGATAPLASTRSATQIRINAPSHAYGNVNLVALSPTGTAVQKTAVTYGLEEPSTNSLGIQPFVIKPAGGIVRVRGSHFLTPASGKSVLTHVLLGGVTVLAGAVAGKGTGSTVIQVDVPPWPSGTTKIVKITTPAGSITQAGRVQYTTSSGKTSLPASIRPTIATLRNITSDKPSETVTDASAIKVTGTDLPTQGVGLHTLTVGGHLLATTKATMVSTFGSTSFVIRPGALKTTSDVSLVPGKISISVTATGTLLRLTTTFTLDAAPVSISSITPALSPRNEMTQVHVYGAHFLTPLTGTPVVVSVTFATGHPATALSVVSTTSLVATAPTSPSTGKVAVSLLPAVGTAATLSDGFTYTTPISQTISSLSKSSGPTAGGTTIVVAGSNLGTPTSVFFGTTKATITSSSASQIVVHDPQHANGSVTVSLTFDSTRVTAPTTFTYLAPGPSISALTPSLAPSGGGTTVTITGANFETAVASQSNIKSVTFGGSTASTFNVTSTGKKITAVTPAHTPGTGKIVVSTVTGQVATSPFSFDSAITPDFSTGDADPFVTSGPTITRITPPQESTAGHVVVKISGHDFETPRVGQPTFTVVQFGTTTAYTYTVTTPTTMTATPNIHAPGTVKIKLTTLEGYVYSPTFTFITPTLTITTTGITPDSAYTATTTATVTIYGSNFVTPGTGLNDITYIKIGTENVTLLEIYTTHITVELPTFHVPGEFGVTVENKEGGTVTKTTSFTFKEFVPTITSINQSSGPSTGGTPVRISGSGCLTPATTAPPATEQISFGGTDVASFTCTGTGTYVTTTPPHTSGFVTVTIINITGLSTTLTNAYMYSSAQPTVSSFSPHYGLTTGGTVVNITGSGFGNVVGTSSYIQTVTIGGSLATTVYVTSTTHLHASTSIHAPGTGVVTITTAGGTGTSTPSTTFTYVQPTPTVTSFSPVFGPTTGSTPVRITGAHFYTKATGGPDVGYVIFGGVTSPSFTVTSTSVIHATSPRHTSGPVLVRVCNSNGTCATATTKYTFQPHSPTVGTFTTLSGPTTGGTQEEIRGSHFFTKGTGGAGTSDVISVTFGTSEGTTVSVTATTLLLVRTPPHMAAVVSVKVTTSGGSADSTDDFSYVIPAPVVTSITPASGPTVGGSTITIEGSHFRTNVTPATIVSNVEFGGVSATSVSVENTGEMKVKDPQHLEGTVTVTVTTSGGSATAPNQFFYTSPKPDITSVTPPSGPTTGGTQIDVYGHNFETSGTPDILSVHIGTTSPSGIHVLRTTLLTITTASDGAGSYTLFVTGTGGTSNSVTFTYFGSTPVVTSVSPTAGSTAGSETVTILGSGFVGTTSVSFGGTFSPTVSSIGAFTLHAKTPPHAPGTVTVSVTTPSGTGTGINAFTYTEPSPVVDTISPDKGLTTGDTTVTVTGSGFFTIPDNATLVSAVRIGGTFVNTLTVKSTTTFTFVTPPHIYGSVTLSIRTGALRVTNAFTYLFPAPVIFSVTPPTGFTTGGQTITIKGEHFFTNVGGYTIVTSVYFGSVRQSTVTVYSTTLIFVRDTGQALGSVSVEVIGTSGTTAIDKTAFTFVSPAPVLTHVTPSTKTGPTTGGTVVYIFGSHFETTTTSEGLIQTVQFGGTPVTPSNITYFSATEIEVITPPHTKGLVTVEVVTTGGSASLPTSFRYTGVPPLITSLTPSSGTFKGGTTVTFEGSGLEATYAVDFATKPGSTVQVLSGSEITVKTPAVGFLGTVTVTLYAIGATTDPTAFDYVEPAVVITSLTPPTGSVFGATTVEIVGEYFQQPTTTSLSIITGVSFGGSDASQVEITSTTVIHVDTPTHSLGEVTITITSFGKSSQKTTAFTFLPPKPVITYLATSSGPTTGSSNFVYGFYFQTPISGADDVTSISIGGTTVTTCYVTSTTTIDLTMPPHLAGPVTISVTNPAGTTVVPDGYTYDAPLPVISTFSPSTGPSTGGTQVMLTGSGFEGANTVEFGTSLAATVSITTGHTMSAVSPAHVPASVKITLEVTSQKVTSTATFTYYAPQPQVTSVTPRSGPATGGQIVTIKGSGFLGATQVTFGTQSTTTFTVTGPKTITVITPLGSRGTVSVSVATPGGTGTLADAFTYELLLPSISTISPDTGFTTGTTPVTIKGSHFVTPSSGTPLVSTLSFGGTAASEVTVKSTTALTANIPPHTGGKVAVSISSSFGGTTTVTTEFTYDYHTPVISSVQPRNGPTTGSTQVTVYGNYFTVHGTEISAVTMGGNLIFATTFTSETGTAIEFHDPAHKAGTVAVEVIGTYRSGQKTDVFTYLPNTAQITSVSPTSGVTTGGTTVTIEGSGLIGTMAVQFGSVTGSTVTVLGPNEVSATTPLHAPGTVTVSLTSTGGHAILTNAFTFRTPTLSVSTVSPTSAPTTGGTLVTINGTGFETAATNTAIAAKVDFGLKSATSLTIVSSKVLTVVTPSQTKGFSTVLVATATTTHIASKSDAFYFYLRAPVVTAVTPTTGSVYGGTTVTIVGSGFWTNITEQPDVENVYFGTSQASAVTVESTTKLSVSIPSHPSGKVNVSVENVTTKSGTKKTAFTYVPPAPQFDGNYPTGGLTTGGTTVYLYGTYFLTPISGLSIVTSVTFGGKLGTIESVVSLFGTEFDEITVLAPSHARGSVTIKVTTLGGSVTLTDFTYQIPTTTVTAFSPGNGPTTGGTTITLYGDHFITAGSSTALVASVYFGATSASTLNVVSTTKLTVKDPVHGPSSVPVEVSSTSGTLIYLQTFNYFTPSPSLTSITPAMGRSSGGTLVTVVGNGFKTAGTGKILVTSVTFTGTPVTSMTVKSGTSLTVTIPAHKPGTVTVLVVTTVGTVRRTDFFTYISPKASVTSVTPTSGTSGGGALIKIEGTHFETSTTNASVVSAVLMGNFAATIVSVTSTTLLYVYSPSHAAGPGAVQVITTGGTSTATQTFSFEAPGPLLTTLSPVTGPAGGNTVVTLSGSNFQTPGNGQSIVASVKFATLTASTVTVTATTKLTAKSPPHAAGPVAVSVVTVPGAGKSYGGGTASKTDAFTYSAPLSTITSLTPATGSVTGGTRVTIVGTNFETSVLGKSVVTSVSFGTATASTITVASATSITAKTSVHKAGLVTVTVTEVDGPVTKSDAYRYVVISEPGAPSALKLVGGDGSAQATWSVPAGNGAPITSFVLVLSVNGKAQTPIVVASATPGTSLSPVQGAVDTYDFAGLANGSLVSFTVAASNEEGTGPQSTPSVSVETRGVPGAPTHVTASAQDKQATLSWLVPSDKGTTITSFAITPYRAGVAELPISLKVKAGSSTSAPSHRDHLIVRGLSNDVKYRFAVAAINGIGTGPASFSGYATAHSGYWVATTKGVVEASGDAKTYKTPRSTGAKLATSVVGMAATPDNKGYWLVERNGGVFAYGDAHFYGSMRGRHLNASIVGIASAPTGHGYWLAAADGGVFAFGPKATFYGSTGALSLKNPIAAIASAPTGHGYWLVDSHGGVIGFGKGAHFYGSITSKGQKNLKPIVSISSTPTGLGYLLVARNGKVTPFGSAKFFGTPKGKLIKTHAVGIASSLDGRGYWVALSNGTIDAYGDAEKLTKGVSFPKGAGAVASIVEMH